MLCEKCQKRPACVHIKVFGPDGKSQDQNLCLQCALYTMPDKADLSRFLQILEENAGENGAVLPIPIEELRQMAAQALQGKPEKRCEHCGLTGTQLRKKQSIGCPKCLDVFREEIRDFLKEPLAAQRRHQASSTGLPTTTLTTAAQEQLADLRAELAKAVKAEQYEQAAELRRQITALNRKIAETAVAAARRPEQQAYLELCNQFNSQPQTDYFPTSPDETFYPVWAPRHLGQEEIIRVSSFVRYTRNLTDFSLPPYQHATLNEATEVATRLLNLLQRDPLFADATILRPGKSAANAEAKRIEQEDVLIGSKYMPQSFSDRPYPVYLLVSANRRAFARINDENHLLVEIWGAPEDCTENLQIIRQLDVRLAKHLTLAADQEFGALTKDLASLGSGIVMGEVLHLPCLTMDKLQEKLSSACRELQLSLTSFNVLEKGDAYGLYSLTTTFAQGETLYRRARMVARGATILERHERAARLMTKSWKPILDRLGRAAGVVHGAKCISRKEALYLLSMLWLGKELGCFPNVRLPSIFRFYRFAARADDQYDLPCFFALMMSRVLLTSKNDTPTASPEDPKP